MLTINIAFEGENSTQKILLNLEKSGLVHAVKFAPEKAQKLRDNVRLGNYSKVHPGE
jgi:hypothetical protein